MLFISSRQFPINNFDNILDRFPHFSEFIFASATGFLFAGQAHLDLVRVERVGVVLYFPLRVDADELTLLAEGFGEGHVSVTSIP